MPTNQDTLFRHWHMLRLIPRYPRSCTIDDILAGLSKEGFAPSRRTIQRDLNELSCIFPLVQDDSEKVFRWSWSQDARTFDLPGLTVAEALVLALAEQHLSTLLPKSFTQQLQPHFKAAKHRLDGEPTPQRGRPWLNKVRSIAPSQPLIAPDIFPQVQEELSLALLNEKQVDLRYRKKGKNQLESYTAHPLGLILRGPVIYLACRLRDYVDVRLLALHRIVDITMLDKPAECPPGFDLDRVIDEGRLSFGKGNRIALSLRFSAEAGEHLSETPLSKDQTIETLNDGSLRVCATVADTPQLVWWILAFGPQVTVESPPELRQRIALSLQRAARNYD